MKGGGNSRKRGGKGWWNSGKRIEIEKGRENSGNGGKNGKIAERTRVKSGDMGTAENIRERAGQERGNGWRVPKRLESGWRRKVGKKSGLLFLFAQHYFF